MSQFIQFFRYTGWDHRHARDGVVKGIDRRIHVSRNYIHPEFNQGKTDFWRTGRRNL